MPSIRTSLTEGPVGRRLIRLTIPMIWGILTTMLFSVVDTYFIGRLGPTPLAAIGFTFPVVFLVTGTAMGMGIGMSSVVSRAVGEGRHRNVAELTSRGLLLTALIVLGFVTAGLVLHDTLFRLLGASEELIPLIRSYMIPWFCGIILLVIPMVGNSAIRATGDTFTPSLIMVLAGVVNVILDPLLIFGLGPFPRLELQGAAIATILSYSVTFVAGAWILIRREKLILFEIPAVKELLDAWRRILYIGLPAVGTNLLVPLANGIITRIMAGYGPDAVAAFGVGVRIESLTMVGSFALSTAIAPFAGQNFGAGRRDRVWESIRFSFRYCLAVSTVLWVILAIGSRPIAGLFTDDPVIVDIIRPFLLMVPLSYSGFGFMLQVAATFNAANRPKYSVWLFLSRLFVFTVPLALLGSYLAGIPGVFAAMFIGNVGSGTLAWILACRKLRAT